jgi:hypothetical protein
VDDPVVRPKLGRIVAERGVQRNAALRMLCGMQNRDGAGPHASIVKLSYSEFEQRLFELALEILGPYGQFTVVDPERLDSRIVTYSGSRRDVGVRVSLVPRGDDLRGIVGDPARAALSRTRRWPA